MRKQDLSMKVRVCFEIDGLAETEHGTPASAGLDLVIGASDKPIDYWELTRTIDKAGVLRMCGLEGTVEPEAVKLITPDEYDLKYVDDEGGEINQKAAE